MTRPAIDRPSAPASEGAALASEPLTPYFDLGASANDGLAPGDTYAALHTACMNVSGYGQYAASTPYFARANRGLGFPQPFGPWGYIGVSLAVLCQGAQRAPGPAADGIGHAEAAGSAR